MEHVVIIGNGIAGITAARHIRKLSDFRITVISSETEYFFSRTALMYVYMGHLKFENTKPYEDWFWKKNRIDLVFDRAIRIDSKQRRVTLGSGASLTYNKLVIACGSRSSTLGVPGEQLNGAQCLYSYQDLRQMETNTRSTRRAVIVGGGLIGVEMAEMLHSRKIETHLLIREPAYWNNVLPMPEARMISRHIASHGIVVSHNTTLQEILGDADGKVCGIRTTAGDEIACDFVGLAVGVQPNIDWLNDTEITVKKGILVNAYLETNIPGIYAAGDCVERRYTLEGRKDIEQVWYTARMMGEVVAQNICGRATPYDPGPWFNAAKFFDIEFQTYGQVGNVLQPGEDELYWEHASGRKAIHVVWDKDTRRFSGINTFGIRMRHEVFNRWLREERSIDFVVANLSQANFDPEFTQRHEPEIQSAFNRLPVEQ